jgi:hypothetical protein
MSFEIRRISGVSEIEPVAMRTEIDSSPETQLAVWGISSVHRHGVHFYEDDVFLLEGLGRFIGTAILAGDSAIVILTRTHRDGLFAHLKGLGLDLAVASSKGRFICLDPGNVYGGRRAPV